MGVVTPTVLTYLNNIFSEIKYFLVRNARHDMPSTVLTHPTTPTNKPPTHPPSLPPTHLPTRPHSDTDGPPRHKDGAPGRIILKKQSKGNLFTDTKMALQGRII